MEGIVKGEYEKNLKGKLKQPWAKLVRCRLSVFQHNNDPKHTSLLLKKGLNKVKVNVATDRPASSPDLNHIENL